MVTHKSCVFPAESIYSENRGHEGWRPMTKLDGEQSPPFEVMEPAEWRAAVAFYSPPSLPRSSHRFPTPSRRHLSTPRRPGDKLLGGTYIPVYPRGSPHRSGS